MARSILIVKMIAELLGKFTNEICKRDILIYAMLWAECPRFRIACGKTNQQSMDLETWLSTHTVLWGIKWQHFMTYMLSAVLGKLRYLSERLFYCSGLGSAFLCHKKGWGTTQGGCPRLLLTSLWPLEWLYSLNY